VKSTNWMDKSTCWIC